MKMSIDEDLFWICNEIIEDNHTEQEWAGLESSDMFQRGRYNGGFDADDMLFAFSFKDDEKVQWSLALNLEEVSRIARSEKTEVDIDRWDDLYNALESDVQTEGGN